jgi:hypothetical protein
MAYGSFNGMTESDPALRALFTRENLLASDWYQQRLATKQAVDVALWKRHAQAVKDAPRKQIVEEHLAHVESPEYLTELVGTLGAEPSLYN